MPTVLQFFSDALAAVGAADPGQTPPPSRIEHARRKFAGMVRSWSATRLRLFYIPEASYALVANKGSYTIGPDPAADFNTTNPAVNIKPVFIQSARVIVGSARIWPLNIVSRPQWDVLPTKTLKDPDGPTDLFYDFGVKLARINLAPMPANPLMLFVSQWDALKVFAEGDEQLNVEDYYPDEYLRPLQLGLSIEMAPTYHFQVGQELATNYADGLARIEKMNADKLSGAFWTSRTLQGPTKGDDTALPQQQQGQ